MFEPDMKKIFTKLFLICFLAPLMAQDKGTIENSNFRMFELIQETDTINFIKIPSDITETKPVLLVLQGSLPIPLGIKYPQGISYTSFPYQLKKEYTDNYHVVAISMPDIPVIVEKDEITNRGTYILSEQSWVQQKQFFLFGHSQGSYVAIKHQI